MAGLRWQCGAIVVGDHGSRLEVFRPVLLLPIWRGVCRSCCLTHDRLRGEEGLRRDEGRIGLMLPRWGTLRPRRESLLALLVQGTLGTCCARNPLVTRQALGSRTLENRLSRDRIREGREGRTLLRIHLRRGLLNLGGGLPGSNAMSLS